jgi:hypothetical protein
MARIVWPFLAMLALVGSASAQEHVIALSLPPGRHFLIVDVKPDGTATASPLAVVKPGGIAAPTPGIVPSPLPPVAGGLSEQVAKIVASVQPPDQGTAAELAEMYLALAQMVDAGEVGSGRIKLVLEALLAQVLAGKPQWKTASDNIRLAYNATSPQYSAQAAAALRQVAQGLNGNAAIGDGKLIKWLMLIAKILLAMKGVG